MMNKWIKFVFVLVVAFYYGDVLSSPEGNTAWNIFSPENKTEMVLVLDQKSGTLNYSLNLLDSEKKVVLQPSNLGLIVDGHNYNTHLVFNSKSMMTTHTEKYLLVSGKKKQVQSVYNRCDFTFKTRDGYKFKIRFHVFDEGVAFRYEIESLDNNESCYILSEKTTFNLPDTGKMWGQPYDYVSKWTPAYEAYFENGIAIGTRAPEDKNGWALPILFQTEGVWTLITETGIYDDNAAIHLQPECVKGVYKVRFAEDTEAYDVCSSIPRVKLPWKSPWRSVCIGNSLNQIFETNLMTTLAEEKVLKDTEWIKPGRASWSWWSASESPRDYNALKQFVDFSSDMGWEYSLVDANWNEMQDGDLEKLADYARNMNVGLLVWYNSGGHHNIVEEAPRNQMHDPVNRRKTFAWLQEIGIKGVKVDFFQSDKSCIMQQYIDILEDAAKYKLVVNFHGCTIPRGWRRTYPNLLTMEAVKGAECYKFDKNFSAAAPWLNTIYPFTRNVVGPMDYTPVTFSHNTLPHFTTFGHELALSVVFETGIIHFADAVEAYRTLPEFVVKFMKNIPVTWDESLLLSGYPGKEVVVARRKGDQWYVGGINGEFENKIYNLKFDFIEDGEYEFNLILDGMTNTEFEHTTKSMTRSKMQTVRLLPFGGFVAVITPKNN